MLGRWPLFACGRQIVVFIKGEWQEGGGGRVVGEWQEGGGGRVVGEWQEGGGGRVVG